MISAVLMSLLALGRTGTSHRRPIRSSRPAGAKETALALSSSTRRPATAPGTRRDSLGAFLVAGATG
jgi:hypothetical protein